MERKAKIMFKKLKEKLKVYLNDLLHKKKIA